MSTCRNNHLSMYKLGFSVKEMRKTIGQKIRVLLWIPFAVAIAIMWAGILYINTLATVSSVSMSLKYSPVFIGVYLLFYQFVFRIYRKSLN